MNKNGFWLESCVLQKNDELTQIILSDNEVISLKDRNIDILFNVLSVVTLITLHKNHSNCYFNHSFQSFVCFWLCWLTLSFVLNTYYTHSFTLTNRNEINDLLLITHSSNTFYSFQQILHITQYHPHWMKVSKWQDNLQYHNPS